MSFGFAPTPQKRRRVESPPLVPQTGDCPYSEFRSSAIPDWYAQLAAGPIEGRAALETLTENGLTGRNSNGSSRTAYLNQHDRRLLDRYESACEAGGWEARQASLEGIEPVAHLKLRRPRRDKDGDPIKYETPYKTEAAPMLAPFTWEMGLATVARHCPKRVTSAYRKRFKASGMTLSDIDLGFWDFVEANPEIPLVIGEGWKKGCSVSVRGYPTLSLRGVRCFFQKRRLRTDPSAPREACDRLFVKGRQVVIAFDKDDKPKTVKDVRKALDRIAEWLAKRGCKVKIASWDKELGKGIDDVLYAIQSEKGEDAAQTWLDETIEYAKSYKSWKRSNTVEKTLAKIYQIDRLSFPVERETEGEYLPQLPTLSPGAVHVLDATMNSGKTVRIGADWVKSAVAAGWGVLVLSPLNSLGQQTAEDWDLPHIHDYALDRASQHALWADVSSQGGIVMCYDSLHRLPQWFFERDGKPRPILLACDEASQGIKHLTDGGTLGSRWEDIVGKFSTIARHASQHGAIVLSEDGIPDRAVEFVRSVATAGHGATTGHGVTTGYGVTASHEGENIPVRVFKHRKKARPWDVTLYEGQASGYRRKLLDAIGSSEKPILFVTASQAEGERLEREVSKRFPEKKFIRIDSDTNEGGEFRQFFANPDRWLQEHRPDILSISPSVKSGVSIEGGVDIESAYFGSVWGYFSCGSLDTWLQLLGRYRPPVARHIFIPPLIQRSSDEAVGASWAVVARLKKNAETLGRAIDFDNDVEIDSTVRELQIEQAALDYISKSLTVSGAQKLIAKDALIDRLERAGHRISIERAPMDKEIAASWKETQDEIWRDRARFAAGLKIDPEVNTKDWAIEQLQKLEVGREMRVKAQKVLWRSEFPGIGFDDEGECYEAIYKDYGRMKRGVKMQAMAERPDRAKASEAEAIASILKGNIRALHRLPKNAAKAVLLAHLGILELLDGESYSNTDLRVVTAKERALKCRNEIRYWLNLNINDEQTPVEICHKLLVRLGFEVDRKNRPGAIETVGRPGQRGDSRNRIYRVNGEFSPTRTRLLEAYRRKLSGKRHEPVSTISTTKSTYIEIMDTKPQTPENTGSAGGVSPPGDEGSVGWRSIFNPENPCYDSSMYEDGQRVRMKRSPERVGRLRVVVREEDGKEVRSLQVAWNDGELGCYYPNQLEVG